MNARKKADEETRLSDASRDGVLAAIEVLHRLGLPGLAQHIDPVTNTLIPSQEADALTRIETLKMLLRGKPMVMAVLEPVLAAAEAQLQADADADGEMAG